MTTKPDKHDHPAPELTDEVLQAIAQERYRAKEKKFDEGITKLSEETGFTLAPMLILPGGEQILLSSWLKAHNIQAVPHIKIIPK